MALLLWERQQNWWRVVTGVFRTIGVYVIRPTSTFLRFLNPKRRDFLRFCRVLYVFSNYDTLQRRQRLSYSIGTSCFANSSFVFWHLVQLESNKVIVAIIVNDESATRQALASVTSSTLYFLHLLFHSLSLQHRLT